MIPNAVVKHFVWLRDRSPIVFCWVVALESTLLGIVTVYAMLYGLELYDELDTEPPDAIRFVLHAVILAPILETLFLQMVPILIARRLKWRVGPQVTCSLIPFALFHNDGLLSFVSAGLIGGFYLAYTCAVWMEHSWRKSLAITVSSHALMNALAGLLMILEIWLSALPPIPNSMLLTRTDLGDQQRAIADRPYPPNWSTIRFAPMSVYSFQDHAIVEIGRVRFVAPGRNVQGSVQTGINVWPKRNEGDGEFTLKDVITFKVTSQGTICRFAEQQFILDECLVEIQGVRHSLRSPACVFLFDNQVRIILVE